MLKKITALVLAMGMVLSVFTGCRQRTGYPMDGETLHLENTSGEQETVEYTENTLQTESTDATVDTVPPEVTEGTEATEDTEATVSAEPHPLDEKIYHTMELEDDFVDWYVVVCLTHTESIKFKDYDVSDFPELELLYVANSSSAVIELLQRHMANGTLDQCLYKLEEFTRYLVLALKNPGKENVLKACDILMQRPEVRQASPDPTVYLYSTNDTYYDEQWAIEKIDLPDAWASVTGTGTVRIGVMDTGIDHNHPDLDGLVEEDLGRTCVTGEYKMTIGGDSNGHGTHVAGIIAALHNNGIGITGSCPNVSLVNIQAMHDSGGGGATILAAAIEYASTLWGTSNQIDLLNFSGGFTTEHPRLHNAIQAFPGLIICAAGNDGTDNDSDTDDHVVYPADYNYDNLLVVGSTDQNDARRSSSNYGATRVDLFAPGVSILSCFTTSICKSASCTVSGHHAVGYHYMTGTSMATPYVTGIAALILLKYPDFTAEQIKAHIMRGVDPVSSLSNLCVTGGRLNAYEAVQHRASSYQQDNVTYHKCVCVCGYIYRDTHNYVLMASSRVAPVLPGISQYQCTECGQTTTVLPYSLPEEHSLY